jgi:hypothetical protein
MRKLAIAMIVFLFLASACIQFPGSASTNTATNRSDVLMGKPADEIIDYAHKNPFNLIVMARHGRSGISRWEYGSVADKVLHGVSSPVFLVRPHLNIQVKPKSCLIYGCQAEK